MDFVTDRTIEDVLLQTEKGKYSANDLNRVEEAVSELYSLAEELGITPPGQFKTDWSFPIIFDFDEWPTKYQMQRYLANITHLCTSVGVTQDLPASMDNLTFVDANNIEKALEQASPNVENAKKIFYFSGEVFAGEENVL